MEKRYKKLVFFIFLIAISLNGYSQADFDSPSDVATYAPQLTATAEENDPFFVVKQDIAVAVYPNPATIKTTIAYTLPTRTTVFLRVVDLSGRQLVVLLTKQVQDSGKHEVEFNFEKYHILPGMYILHLLIDNKTYSKKVIVQ
ncbi:MAG: T9SS type A sorting domain-containing protein [Bacteroidota bacterium]